MHATAHTANQDQGPALEPSSSGGTKAEMLANANAHHDRAALACRLLVAAYLTPGSVDWTAVDDALAVALSALGLPENFTNNERETA